MAGEYVGAGLDIVGDQYDIVGADPYDVGYAYDVGAGPAERRPQQRPGATPRMMGNPQAGVRVARDEGDVMRRQIAPLPVTVIPAGTTIQVNFRPQRPIRIERLVLDGTVAAGGSIAGVFLTDILIGAEPQLVNSGGIPVTVFQPTAFGTSLRGNTAQPGIEVTLTFRNANVAAGQDATIGGAVIGTSIT